MARPYSDDLREPVVAAMACGESCRCVAVRFGVAPSSMVKWTQRAARTGSVRPAQMGGCRKPVLEAHRDRLLARVCDPPETTLEGLQALLAERWVEVSHDTVSRFLRACGLSFKKKSLDTGERASADVSRRRARWKRHQARIDPTRLVFVD